MKAIKAIGVALISLMTFSAADAQEVIVRTQPYYGKKKVVVTEHKRRYHSPHGRYKSEVIVDKHYGGYRRPYYYDNGRSRYYYMKNGRREYYYHGWRPSY